ncbi:HNH endonuclease [Candidatus Desantisbacteria bacterium CG_4_10_14_0_8_um_filter_48_22]|uniref:HNH endonuclease n=1 Tax=Candidatus Desantisbacteria bacterium CG_4_10_14_0_8_um_filter_48_22 TaxID=1974543 RepID=A0A2M7SDZ7_9BACT|nr:MAG: HNH endonuclease [Candidatus Desantisbacteria bacterium CG1_02_49_89]PIZ17701.1 MAG: HNH endonuclease [Candidatus Desantisbacteria bacterium CG_4_10_14_0_8_um_filter_48_22]
MENNDLVQSDLIMEYFKKHSKKEIAHPEIVDWVVNEYKKRTGKVFRDPDRAIRKLSQEGQLIKIKKGVYKYDPDFVINKALEDFTIEQKEAIFKRDRYKCVVCGRGTKDGVEIHADHIRPKDLGGKAEIENGQTLCAQHNFQKKNYKQTETGKKMFIRLYELAKKYKDQKLKKFCKDVLMTYENHKINCHIKWEK